MTEQRTDTVGTVSVDIVGNLEPLEEALQQAEQMAQSRSRRETRPAQGHLWTPQDRGRTNAGRDAAPIAANVEAKVKATVARESKAGMGRDVQAMLDDTEATLKVMVDTVHLKGQLDNFFAQEFKVKISAGEVAGMGIGTAHGPVVTTGAAMGRGAPPADVLKGFDKPLREAVDNIYRNLSDAFERSNKPFFGRQSTGVGNQVEKLAEIIGEFGDDFGEWIKVGPGITRPTVGGSMAPKALAARYGLDPEDPSLQSFDASVRPLVTPRGKDPLSDIYKGISRWMNETPMGASSPQQAAPVAQAVVETLKAEGSMFRTGGEASPTPATDQLETALKAVRTEMGKVPFQDFDLAIPQRTVPNIGTARPDDDPQATARANAQLQAGNRANVRSQIGRFQTRRVNGIDVDIEDLLQDLRAGKLQNVFETQAKKGKLSDEEKKMGPEELARSRQGRLIQLQPKTDAEQLRAAELGRSRRPVTIEGAGRAQPLGGQGALRAKIAARFDDEIADALFNDPQTLNLIRQSAAEGQRTKGLVIPGAPVAGSGEAGGITAGLMTGGGFEKAYRAAFRLIEVQDDLAEAYERLEKAQGSGRGTTGVERHIARLEAQESRLRESAGGLVTGESAGSRFGEAGRRYTGLQYEAWRMRGTSRDLRQQGLASTDPEQQQRLFAAYQDLQQQRQAARDEMASLRQAHPGLSQAARDERRNRAAVTAADRVRSAEARERIARGDDLTQEERERRAMTDPVLLGKRAREMVTAGKLPDPTRIVEEIWSKLMDPQYAQPEENTAQAQRRAYREVTDPLREGLPDKGVVRKEGEKMLADVYRSIFGEKQAVIATSASGDYRTEERRGGLTQINEEARAAVDRADNEGLGTGRRARVVSAERTGASTASGVAETRPIVDRPATSLDMERQTLMSEYEAAAAAVAERENRRQADLIKKRTGPGRLSEPQPIEDILFSPATRGRGGRTVPRGITSKVAGQVEENFPVGQRVAEIRAIQTEADRILKQIAAQTSDIDEQRKLGAAVPTGMSSGGVGAFKGNLAMEREDFTAAVQKEIGEVLETRTAAFARAPKTTGARDPISGDKAREKFIKAGGVAAGSTENVPPFAAFNAGGAGRGRVPPGGDDAGNRFGDISDGVVHVIVDNTPLPISWVGSAPSGTGVSGAQAAIGARDDATKARAATRRMTSDSNMKFVEEFVTKQRDAGKSDAQIRSALKAFGFGGTAALAIDEEVRSVGAAGGARDINARRKLSGLPPVVARGEDFFTDVDQADRARSELAAEARRAERGIPKRGFTASVTDIFSNLGGFLDDQVAAVGRFQREGAQLSSLQAKGPGVEARAQIEAETLAANKASLEEAQTKLASAKASKASTGEIRGFQGEIRALTTAVGLGERKSHDASLALEEYNAELADQTERVKAARKDLPGAGGRAAAFGIGFGAAAGAVAVGQLVAQLSSAVTGAIVEGVGPALERATGFSATTARITGAAADELRTRGGDRGAIAGQFAATGLAAASAQQFSPLVIQRAETEAGNKALREQIDLLHTFENLQRDQRGRGSFDKGISQTTGGFLGTPLFGIPSTQELLVNELKGLPSRAVEDRFPEGGVPIPTTIGKESEQVAEFEQKLKDAGERLDYFNEQANKGGSSMRLLKGDVDEVSKSVDLARQAGLFDLADTLQAKGLTVKGAESSVDLQSFLASVGRGSTTPDPRLLLEETARQREAQIQLQDSQRRFALETSGPQSLAIARAQQPFTNARSGINLEGASTKQQAAFNKELDTTQKMYDEINKEVDLGIKQAKEFVSTTFAYDPQVGVQFADSLDRVVSLSKEIASIEVGVQTKQAAFQALQYSHQIDIAKRSLQDAKGLAGDLGKASKDNLGVLEREQFLLQRRSQLLALELNQRQINFQRSIAGFTAPGLTGEERAARIKQAKIEADFAQKQLDIQKKLVGLQGKQFTISADRQVLDLTRQLSLLEKGRELTISTAVAEKRIRALSAIREKELKRVETIYEAAIARTNDIMALTAQLAAATGKAMGGIASDVIKQFRSFYVKLINVIDDGMKTGLQEREELREEQQQRRGIIGAHTGFAGNISGMQDFTVGEAGTETVAVLKNPRGFDLSSMMTPMGGSGEGSGGAPIIIQVSGNKFSTKEEQDMLVRKIASAVEEAQSRRLALSGLRTP